MWTKLLPEAGRCNLIFLLEAAGGGQNFCRRLGSSMVVCCFAICLNAIAAPLSLLIAGRVGLW